MVLLNLLPHRELARLRQRRRWHAMLGAALGVSALVGGVLYVQGQQRLLLQEQATAVLEEAVARMGPQAAETRKLQSALRAGRERLQQWQAWQHAAQQRLRLLEVLERELPADTALTRLEQEPGQLVVQGQALSREAVTALREAVDGSGVAAQPALLADVREEQEGVVFRLVIPVATGEEGGARMAAGASTTEGGGE